MTFGQDADRDELRSAVRRLLGEKASSELLRDTLASGAFDRALWEQMARQLGLHGLAIPEEYGGSGFGPLELSVAFEELGRVLLAAPFFSSVGLAASVLLSCDDETAKKDLLPGIADGSTIATLACTDLGGHYDLDRVPASAESTDDGWVVSGETAYVTDGMAATMVLVPAATAEGLSLFAVDPDVAGVERVAMDALDLTRPLAKLTFDAAPARLVGTAGDARGAVGEGLQLAVTYLSAEQVGAAGRCLEMSVDYAKIRVQFERPIGSFQAIKHMCADMLVRVEAARSAALYAAQAIADDLDERDIAVAVAGAYCADAFFFVAARTLQVHGGIGYTWEHDAHLYLRRAKSGQLLFGSPDSYRDRLADLVGF